MKEKRQTHSQGTEALLFNVNDRDVEPTNTYLEACVPHATALSSKTTDPPMKPSLILKAFLNVLI